MATRLDGTSHTVETCVANEVRANPRKLIAVVMNAKAHYAMVVADVCCPCCSSNKQGTIVEWMPDVYISAT
jgi:hypothetical protein